MYNVFLGNETIRLQICESLGLDKNDRFGYTDSMYFEAFFYLTKRYGAHFVQDEYKDAAIWDFKVKHYNIRVLLSSSRVTFIVFGPVEYLPQSPLWARLRRMAKRGEYNHPWAYFDDDEKWKEGFVKYLNGQGISPSDASQTDFDNFKKLVEEQAEAVFKTANKKYKDEEYSNSYTRHALRTLDQFLKNMLTPIYVRDVGFNIKGRCGCEFDNYKGNVEILKIESNG